MSDALSIRAYAKRRGVSHTAVRRALAAGRITRGPEGKIDPELADQQWAANTDETKPLNSVSGNPHHRQETPGLKTPVIPAAGLSPADLPEPAGAAAMGATAFTQSRAVREGYLARLAKLDYEKRAGKLIDADEVRAVAFQKARSARDRLMTIPDRLSARLAAETDPSKVHALLTGEIRKACEELAGERRG